MKPHGSDEVAALLARWERIDEDAGERAATRRREHLERTGRPVVEYRFAEPPNDWVHRDWMRPIRFLYRNIPTGARMRLKKRLVK